MTFCAGAQSGVTPPIPTLTFVPPHAGIFLGLYAFRVIITTFTSIFLPTQRFKYNSHYYSAIPTPITKGATLPFVVIQLPVRTNHCVPS